MANMSGFLKCGCPQCGQHIEFRVEESGQNATCPSCQREFVLPFLETKPVSSIRKVILLTVATIIFVVLIVGGLIFAAKYFDQKAMLEKQHIKETELIQQQKRNEVKLAEVHKREEAAHLKAEADALLASGRFLCTTNEIDDKVHISTKLTTGLGLFIWFTKQGKPALGLSALDLTGETANNTREPISGFDSVRCRIGNDVFSLKTKWSIENVKVFNGGTFQGLYWPIPEDTEASSLLLHILSSDSPIKVEFSSSFMGGSSYTFTMSRDQIHDIKDVLTIYRSFPNADPVSAK